MNPDALILRDAVVITAFLGMWPVGQVQGYTYTGQVFGEVY